MAKVFKDYGRVVDNAMAVDNYTHAPVETRHNMAWATVWGGV